VHHTASGNDYRPEEVPGLLRSFYSLHTGASKGWPDVAYNFFIDRYGTVWEGRAGSLEGPVMPDATGGSQGFAQLCCFVGDHSAEAPTPEARRSMVALLASLAETYGIDPAPGATASFISRGSNRWPAGVPVTTTTIAGHRDMSLTLCPGDAAYALVRTEFPMQASALMAARPTSPPASSGPASGAPATRAARGARDGDGSPDASAWMAGATVSGGLAALTAVVLRRPRTPPRPDAAHGEAPPTGCDELGQL
jgi:N-acetylmuramoyl-L-alanine amidase